MSNGQVTAEQLLAKIGQLTVQLDPATAEIEMLRATVDELSKKDAKSK